MEGEKAFFIALVLSIISLLLLILGIGTKEQWLVIIGVVVKLLESFFFWYAFIKLAFD